MNVILDTHSFLWFGLDDNRLSINAKREIESPINNKFISIASLWEMAIKTG